MIAALLLAINLAQLWRDTNSHAANVRGVKAYAAKKYPDAVKAFTKEKPSPSASFNMGTAQIAGGEREAGSQTITKATNDPALRGDALYNRGYSALSAKSYDYAIHDFTEALKANPSDASAKRNLEIALAKKAQQQSSGGKKNQQGPGPQPQPQPQQNPQQREKTDPNSEALLRSVQEQEQEELARMHRAKPDRARVGW
jgi:tetratricopeptide (TPR) repeat protein